MAVPAASSSVANDVEEFFDDIWCSLFGDCDSSNGRRRLIPGDTTDPIDPTGGGGGDSDDPIGDDDDDDGGPIGGDDDDDDDGGGPIGGDDDDDDGLGDGDDGPILGDDDDDDGLDDGGDIGGIDNPGVVPEPGTIALLSLGAAFLAIHSRKRRRR